MRKIQKFQSILAVCISLCLGIAAVMSGTTEKVRAAQKEATYLSEIEVNAEVKDSYPDSGKYDQNFFNKINSEYGTNYNSSAQPLTISNEGELAAFAKAVNDGKSFEGKYVKLMNDIDLKGDSPFIKKIVSGDKFKLVVGNASGQAAQKISNVWKPIGQDMAHSFKGEFDGNNKKIKGMVVISGSRDEKYSGFFGGISKGVIKNLNIEEAYVISKTAKRNSWVGGLTANNSEGTVNDVHMTGTVLNAGSGQSFAGGLVGYNVGTIENSSSEADVFCYNDYNDDYTNTRAGGLAAYSHTGGTIKNCSAAGDVAVWSNNFSMAGGLTGYNYENAVIEKSYAAGKVSSFVSDSTRSSAGGLVSYNYGGVIRSCLATGDVASGVDYAGTNQTLSYAGGLMGENIRATGKIEESCATGNVSFLNSDTTTAYGGGLVGSNNQKAQIKNSCAAGSVSGASYGGGLAGENKDDSSVIENSYAAGDVSALNAGGLVSRHEGGTINGCYRNSKARVAVSGDLNQEGNAVTPEQMTGTG
ncbi:GLUG motif-containing protein, partial [Anaerostipes sp.]|uniref:GLUG motif-containing protein n=1 Tax=Anaerostipes sp. TaxID=1872530 RepID=UPI0025C1F7A0